MGNGMGIGMGPGPRPLRPALPGGTRRSAARPTPFVGRRRGRAALLPTALPQPPTPGPAGGETKPSPPPHPIAEPPLLHPTAPLAPPGAAPTPRSPRWPPHEGGWMGQSPPLAPLRGAPPAAAGAPGCPHPQEPRGRRCWVPALPQHPL